MDRVFEYQQVHGLTSDPTDLEDNDVYSEDESARAGMGRRYLGKFGVRPSSSLRPEDRGSLTSRNCLQSNIAATCCCGDR